MNLTDNYAIMTLAAGFAIMGVGSLLKPALVTAQFDIPELSAAGRNEVRAVYGGFGILMATTLLVATADNALRPGITFTVAAALIGMAAGRLLSAIIDRRFGRWPFFYFLLEGGCAALLVCSS